MNRHLRSTLAATAVVLALDPGARPVANADRWWSHVRFLASDALQGRDTGSEGHRQAAQYVAAAFERAGLTPGGTSGFFQSVTFRSRRISEDRSRLALVRDGVTEPVTLGDEATFSMRIEPAARVEAPIVFVGYGLTVPELKHDDLAGLDLRGKVALLLTGAPSHIPGPLRAHYQSAGERWAFLKRAGAIGTLAIQNPRGMDIPWERSMLARFLPSLALEDPTENDTAGQQIAVTINPARAEKFFVGSGHTFKDLLALAERGESLPRFPIPARVDATVAFDAATLESDNVVGILPGTDLTLRNEYVAVTAHLDHVGVGRPINDDGIFNGAMDNASGIATLIETATAAHDSKMRFRRSVLFLAVTAEEKGLLGSRHFAAHPTVPASAIVANVNIDMFLPLFPLRSLIAQGLEESDLGEELRRVAGPLGIQVLSDPEPERNAFIRSDQYSFIRRGIPALSLKVGFAKDSPEHDTVKRWRTERYHAPSDDLSQPIDLKAAADFNRVYLQIVQAVADRAERPRWNVDSFFRRFAGRP